MFEKGQMIKTILYFLFQDLMMSGVAVDPCMCKRTIQLQYAEISIFSISTTKVTWIGPKDKSVLSRDFSRTLSQN